MLWSLLICPSCKGSCEILLLNFSDEWGPGQEYLWYSLCIYLIFSFFIIYLTWHIKTYIRRTSEWKQIIFRSDQPTSPPDPPPPLQRLATSLGKSNFYSYVKYTKTTSK